MSGPTPFVVGIAGGSGSGKSALARVVAGRLGLDRVAELRHDDYYVDRGQLPAAARAGLDYDVPEALDTDLFVAHLQAVRAGQPVQPPRYCFRTHRRIGVGPPVPVRPFLLVEGILLLHDARVRTLLDLAIFLDVPEPIRLARRIARDVGERGRTRRSVLSQYEATVRGAHATWVEPTRAHADLVLHNVGRLDRLAEVATSVIHEHAARRPAGVTGREAA